MSTSKLQRAVGNLLDKTFPQFTVRENYRPDWLISPNLTKLELDFYIEELKIAFEIQGDQHFKFIPYFHKTEDEFDRRRLYDQEKKDLCYGQGVKLIEVCVIQDAIIAIKDILETIEPEPTTGKPLTRAKLERANAMRMIRQCRRNYPISNHLQDRQRELGLLCSKFVAAMLENRQYNAASWSPSHISQEEFERYTRELKTAPTVYDAINTLEKYLAVGA